MILGVDCGLAHDLPDFAVVLQKIALGLANGLEHFLVPLAPALHHVVADLQLKGLLDLLVLLLGRRRSKNKEDKIMIPHEEGAAQRELRKQVLRRQHALRRAYE